MTRSIKFLFAISVIYFSHLNYAFSSPYFEGNVIYPTLLEEPFKAESEEREKEIEQIIALQNSVNIEDLKKASAEYALVPEHLIKPLESNITRTEYSKLYHLLDRVEETVLTTKDSIKNYWNSARPYQVSKDIKLLTQISSNNSYPSGHTSKSYAIAYVSGLLMPERRGEFLETAKEISNRRVLLGEHFPSDIRAGRRLSLLIVGGLLQNSEFQKDFQEAKKEIQRHEDAVSQEKIKSEPRLF